MNRNFAPILALLGIILLSACGGLHGCEEDAPATPTPTKTAVSSTETATPTLTPTQPATATATAQIPPEIGEEPPPECCEKPTLPAPATATATPSHTPALYLVQPGDTMSHITLFECGSATGWRAMCEANGLYEPYRCNRIYPGETLVLACEGDQ